MIQDRYHAVSLIKGVANMVSALWHFSRLEKLLTLLTEVSVPANGYRHSIQQRYEKFLAVLVTFSVHMYRYISHSEDPSVWYEICYRQQCYVKI